MMTTTRIITRAEATTNTTKSEKVYKDCLWQTKISYTMCIDGDISPDNIPVVTNNAARKDLHWG